MDLWEDQPPWMFRIMMLIWKEFFLAHIRTSTSKVFSPGHFNLVQHALVMSNPLLKSSTSSVIQSISAFLNVSTQLSCVLLSIYKTWSWRIKGRLLPLGQPIHRGGGEQRWPEVETILCDNDMICEKPRYGNMLPVSTKLRWWYLNSEN